jgi:hypothetical protein
MDLAYRSPVSELPKDKVPRRLTCHRRFRPRVEEDTLVKVLRALAEGLPARCG